MQSIKYCMLGFKDASSILKPFKLCNGLKIVTISELRLYCHHMKWLVFFYLPVYTVCQRLEEWVTWVWGLTIGRLSQRIMGQWHHCWPIRDRDTSYPLFLEFSVLLYSLMYHLNKIKQNHLIKNLPISQSLPCDRLIERGDDKVVFCNLFALK